MAESRHRYGSIDNRIGGRKQNRPNDHRITAEIVTTTQPMARANRIQTGNDMKVMDCDELDKGVVGYMKTIGLIGGTGWISTAEYYRHLNEMVNARLGGLNFAKCIVYSFDYSRINSLNQANDAVGVYRLVLDAAYKIEGAGADCLLLCANTLHQFADEVQCNIDIPLINIAAETARNIKSTGIPTVGLLGTRITMEKEFYKNKLRESGIEPLVPEQDDREFIHETIMRELLKNTILESSRQRFIRIMGDLEKRGAGAIILGCTEIPLLVRPEDSRLPVIDTLQVHCRAAVDYALGSSG
jgi:aspartate racemase